MKGYRFRLAGVARVRAVQERLEREQVAAAQRAVGDARAVETACVQRLRDAPAPVGTVDYEEFTRTRSHAARCARDADSARAQHERAQALLSERVQAWLGARRRVRVLERLDARARSEWKVAAGREDAAVLDDLGITRWSAKRRLSADQPGVRPGIRAAPQSDTPQSDTPQSDTPPGDPS